MGVVGSDSYNVFDLGIIKLENKKIR